MSGPVYHGGRLDLAIASHGGDRQSWLDLSTGINPNAYPIGDITPDAWQRLPGGDAEALLMEAARSYYNVPKGFGIIAANGTQALIEIVPRLMNCQNIAVLSPTYAEHEHAWKKAGRHVECVVGFEQMSFLANALVVVNPNNPTAKLYSPEQLLEFSAEMAKRHGYLIVDEAFCDPFPQNSIVPHMTRNMLIYRSFGKFFGLAGLRLGFLIASHEFIHKAENLIGPWSVSGPALEIGRRALMDQKWIEAATNQLHDLSAAQSEMLVQCGLTVECVNPLFIYTKHDSSQVLFDRLLEKQILVRKFPEMRDRLRFGLCKDQKEIERLRVALANIMDVL
ncbi:MAG: threonine-phosphate decarboxylase CobD [Salaquimonas sp.]